MSVRMSQIVWRQSRARGSPRLVLLALADHADDYGVAWPSQTRLAGMACLDVRNVRRALAELVALGEIKAVGHGPRGVVRYRITLAQPRAEAPYVGEPTPGAGVLGRRRPRAEASGAPRAKTPGVPRAQAPDKPPLEPSLEPPVVSRACTRAVELWNDLAADCRLPRVQKVTAARQKSLAACLKEHGLDGWQTALDRIRATPFLRGEGNRGWRPDLDWLVREENFTKVMEGRYDQTCAAGDGYGAGAPPTRRNKTDGSTTLIAGFAEAVRRRQ